MADVRRYYECGCVPDDEQFCKVGEFLVWTGREAATELGVIDGMPKEIIEHNEKLDAYSHFLMRHHLGKQKQEGKYVDVDLDAVPEPEDDGSEPDEDPRVVGYPS